MSRNKDYQHLLNSKRWRELRAAKLRSHPLCELCEEAGRVVPAVDIHHRIPVESAKSLPDMEALAYDPANLQALCVACHIKVHKEMGKSTPTTHQTREQERLERWIHKHTKQ